ncbi:hypothetical protein [Luteolibacter luteus]|uniref:Uncharacterized protein n=1 Tax=Luteolibacter luteus TaxID=2728835 RepID=A0A858RE37_9BACT|nr:hypothetical protein [Luteolibacter luteus]QJE94871.1 hypothetical protein HHL09_03450 [Luteolibacter luteus]
MSMGASKALLNEATRELFAHWEETKLSWRDAKAGEFENNYLAAIPQAFASATRIIEDLDLVLSKIHADCE